MRRYRGVGARVVRPFDVDYGDPRGASLLRSVTRTVGAAWPSAPEEVTGICRHADGTGYFGLHPSNDPAASSDPRTTSIERLLVAGRFAANQGDALVVVEEMHEPT